MAYLPIPTLGTGSVKILADSGIKQIPSAYIKDKDDLFQISNCSYSRDIPVISLTNLYGRDREQLLGEIRKACEEWGIFQVIDHQVPEEVQKKMIEVAHGFFSLPLEQKMEYAIPPDDLCGYANGSHFKDNPNLDWRELYITRCRPLTRRDVSKWPAKPEDFRDTFARYSDEMFTLQNLLIGVVSESLGLHSKAIEAACGDAEQKVILNYYPICPQAEQTLGLRKHTDPGTITVLYQGDVSGLQVTKDGHNWVTVEPIPGAFVVNLGDQLEIFTNGKFKSAEHRATVNPFKTRTTIAAFRKPAADYIVRPSDALVKEGDRPVFEAALTYSDFYNMRMRGGSTMGAWRSCSEEHKKGFLDEAESGETGGA